MLHKSNKKQNLELTILLFLTRSIFFPADLRVLLVQASPAQSAPAQTADLQSSYYNNTNYFDPPLPMCPRANRGRLLYKTSCSYMLLSNKYPQLQRLSTTLSLLKSQTTSGDISCFHSLLSTCPKPCKTPAYKHNSKAFKMKLKSFRWHRRQAWMRTC